MKIHVEKLADAEQRYVRGMDNEDMTAMKLCLLSAGALVGLSVKSRFARKALGLGCTILAAGLAIPLAKEFLDEVAKDDAPLITAEGSDSDVQIDHEPEETSAEF